MEMKPEDITVLVVDDDEDLREILSVVLSSSGFNVLTAENGIEGMAVFKEHKVDAVISDVRMPKMDGVELLKNVRASNKDVPIFFLVTGFADISESEAKNLGANGFLPKPYDIDTITKSILTSLSIAKKA